jgi:hypothetical protein
MGLDIVFAARQSSATSAIQKKGRRNESAGSSAMPSVASPQLWTPQHPEPLMSRNQAFFGTAFRPRQARRSLDQKLQYAQKVPRDLDVSQVACVMEGDEDLVG